MADECDALVIGAGVVGVTTAYALARRGLKVTIVDRAEEPARGTSYANGGQLSYVYTEALASPGLLRALPRLMLALDPAFRFRPSLDPDFLRWGLAFLRNCTGARFHRHTIEGLRLGLESRAAMHSLLVRHPLDFGHRVSGKLHLIESPAAAAAAAEMVKLKRQLGVGQELIGAEEAARLEPAIAGRARSLAAVVYSPEEEVGDPYLFCAALLARLQSDHGVTVRLGTRVRALEATDSAVPAVLTDRSERLTAGQIAVCTGVETPHLLAETGIKVPIWPMKGYSITAPPGPAAPAMSITDVSRRLVFCRLSGMIRLAGLADLGHRDDRIEPHRLDTLVAAARASLPEAADYDRRSSAWAGLRPMTPSSLPIIRRARKGVVLNVGHGTLGWTFAMGAAERTARLMVEAGR